MALRFGGRTVAPDMQKQAVADKTADSEGKKTERNEKKRKGKGKKRERNGKEEKEKLFQGYWMWHGPWPLGGRVASSESEQIGWHSLVGRGMSFRYAKPVLAPCATSTECM